MAEDNLERRVEGEYHHCGAMGQVWECLECHRWTCRKCRGLIIPESMTTRTEGRGAVVCRKCMEENDAC